ncbi:Alpha/Beta hydrolase fold [Amanita muscaria]
MSFAFRHQPLKGLYLTYQALTLLFLRLPWWITRSLLRSWRPRPSWDIKRAVFLNLIRHRSYVISQTGPLSRFPNHRHIEQDVGEYGVWVKAVPELVKGELEAFATAASVKPATIPGYWIHKSGTNIKIASPPVPDEKVLYRLHGGGYTGLSAHPSDVTATMSHDLPKFTCAIRRVFSIEYRLSSAKPFPVANPFPAALIDALAGYNYLVHDVGFSPSDIVIMGDSAGGNLALALTRYLLEHQHPEVNHMPAPPGALVLVSPWCDSSGSHETPGSTAILFKNVDYLRPLTYIKAAFLGPHGFQAAAKNKYISPSSKSLTIDFKGFPRTFIVAGGLEMLLDEIKTLRARMTEDLGEGDGLGDGEGKVKYLEEPDAVHDYLAFKWHEPEKTRTLDWQMDRHCILVL